MEQERFSRFIRNVDTVQKSIRKFKIANAEVFGIKSVHILWVYELYSHPEGISGAELAAKSMIDRSLISREIADLKENGYVTTEDTGTKRAYNAKIKLTERGREMARAVGAAGRDIQNRADDGITEEELESFYKTFEKLSANLERIAAEKPCAINTEAVE